MHARMIHSLHLNTSILAAPPTNSIQINELVILIIGEIEQGCWDQLSSIRQGDLSSLTILTQTLVVLCVFFVSLRHARVLDKLGLASGDTLTATDLVERPQNDELDPDADQLGSKDTQDTADAGNVIRRVFGVKEEWALNCQRFIKRRMASSTDRQCCQDLPRRCKPT